MLCSFRQGRQGLMRLSQPLARHRKSPDSSRPMPAMAKSEAWSGAQPLSDVVFPGPQLGIRRFRREGLLQAAQTVARDRDKGPKLRFICSPSSTRSSLGYGEETIEQSSHCIFLTLGKNHLFSAH